MIVDTSAIVAIALGEPVAEELKGALEASGETRLAAPSYVELCAVLQRKGRPEVIRLIDRLLHAYDIRIAPFDVEHARVAAQAYRDYGRGSGHPARLNLGDTYGYALAQIASEPLLFVGDDLTHTDIQRAVISGPE